MGSYKIFFIIHRLGTGEIIMLREYRRKIISKEGLRATTKDLNL